jgi:hypothetical protein
MHDSGVTLVARIKVRAKLVAGNPGNSFDIENTLRRDTPEP